MRRLVYEVIADGRYFSTFSYAVATQPGAKIKKTFLVPCSFEDKKHDPRRLELIAKRQMAIRAKRAK